MLANILRRIIALPMWARLLFIVAMLIVLGLLVLLSPLMVALASLVLIVAILALVIRFLRRRPLRRWSIIATTSLVALLVFTGISNALYPNEQPEQASSTEPVNQTEDSDAKLEPAEQSEKRKDIEQADQKENKQSQEIKEKSDVGVQPSPEPPTEDADNNGSRLTVKIMRVVDGDTIEISPSVDGEDTVRLIGIDAPESKIPGCGIQPLAQKAAYQLANWEGSKVKLEFDEERTDRYGRLLAYVHDPPPFEVMLNEDMLLSGYAQLYIVPPNTKYEDRLREIQQQAKEDPVFGTSIWTLSSTKQDQLADHGNGIGEGDGACPPEPQPEPEPTATSTASPNPSPSRNYNVPSPNAPDRNFNAPRKVPRPLRPSADRGMCEPGAHWVGPNGPGDGDGDGCAGES